MYLISNPAELRELNFGEGLFGFSHWQQCSMFKEIYFVPVWIQSAHFSGQTACGGEHCGPEG